MRSYGKGDTALLGHDTAPAEATRAAVGEAVSRALVLLRDGRDAEAVAVVDALQKGHAAAHRHGLARAGVRKALVELRAWADRAGLELKRDMLSIALAKGHRGVVTSAPEEVPAIRCEDCGATARAAKLWARWYGLGAAVERRCGRG